MLVSNSHEGTKGSPPTEQVEQIPRQWVSVAVKVNKGNAWKVLCRACTCKERSYFKNKEKQKTGPLSFLKLKQNKEKTFFCISTQSPDVTSGFSCYKSLSNLLFPSLLRSTGLQRKGNIGAGKAIYFPRYKTGEERCQQLDGKWKCTESLVVEELGARVSGRHGHGLERAYNRSWPRACKVWPLRVLKRNPAATSCHSIPCTQWSSGTAPLWEFTTRQTLLQKTYFLSSFTSLHFMPERIHLERVITNACVYTSTSQG